MTAPIGLAHEVRRDRIRSEKITYRGILLRLQQGNKVTDARTNKLGTSL